MQVWTVETRARQWIRVACACEGISYLDMARLQRENAVLGFKRRLTERGSADAIAYLFEKVRRYVDLNQTDINWAKRVRTSYIDPLDAGAPPEYQANEIRDA